jgi:SPP1 family predicted phage head-tail adaptor
MFKPKAKKFITTIKVIRRKETLIHGMPQISYPDDTATEHMCAFKGFYGQEALYAGQSGIQQGGTITTWYDDTINYRDRVVMDEENYEIISPPENIEQRGVYMTFKIAKVVTPDEN